MSIDFDFRGKICLVSGGGSGIGAQIGIMFSRSGAQVVLTDINEVNVKKVSEECDKVSPIRVKALSIVADITQYEHVESLINTVIRKFHRFDILVNCAGICSLPLITDPNYLSVYCRVLSTNTTSAVSLTNLSAPHLAKTNGNIVNISSIAAKRAGLGYSAYSMSKSAVDTFTKSMAVELGPLGIRVNSVSPGVVQTTILETFLPKDKVQAIIESYGKQYPIGRYGLPDDIASAVLFLSSDAAQFITGTDLVVDGGHLAANIS